MPLYKLSPGSLPGFVDFFNRHAIDNKLSHCVVKGLLHKHGRDPTDSEVDKIIKAISIDPTGIDCQAFLDLVSSYHELRNPDTEYRSAFRIYDVQSQGKLSKDDVRNMFAQMHFEVNVDQLFKDADLDKNGYIDYDEFVTLMKI